MLDVIPVDLAAHAMIPILGALLSKRQKPIYQLCTSDRNPLPMRRLVELTALSNRREHRKDGGAMGWLGPHLEAVVVSQNTYDLASEKLPQLLKQAAAFARSVIGEENPAPRRKSKAGSTSSRRTPTSRANWSKSIARTSRSWFTLFTRATSARFTRRCKPADAEHHPYRPELIDWHDYWINVHMPGLRRHIFPQLDLHTRGRPKTLPRHRSLVDMLERAADRYGAQVAMIARRPSGEQTQTTYRELRDRAHRAALLLATRGIKPGDRVLLIGENSPDWVLALFRDSMRRRDRRAARPADLSRRARTDLQNRGAGGGADIERGS